MADHPIHNEATRAHYNRQMRRNMRKMAEGLGIEPDRYGDDVTGLWAEITTRMASGVASTRERIVGDDFAFFLIRKCGCGAQHTFVIKSPTGGPIDRYEADKMRDYLLAQDNVQTCPECGAGLDGYSIDMTRLSTFSA